MTLPRSLTAALGAYYDGLTRYADFSGTTSLRNYLSFLAINLSITLLLSFLEFLAGDGFFALIGILYGLAPPHPRPSHHHPPPPPSTGNERSELTLHTSTREAVYPRRGLISEASNQPKASTIRP